MKIHDLNLTSHKDSKRVGRGIGSGYGKTSGRGTKGQNARTGGGVRIGFSGGQNPLAKLLPKRRGFRALNPTTYQVIGVADLARFEDGATVDVSLLVSHGLVKHSDRRVKLLAGGEITSRLTVRVSACSAAAKSAIESKGGSVELIKYVAPVSKKPTRPQTTTTQEG